VYGGNTCMPGNCRVDSDCGAGGYCSPSRGSNGCGYVEGYYCHTRADLCVNDSDCAGGNMTCAWSATSGRWECANVEFCP
jgi:Cys-rich repeat protein